jgi:Putative DNA-binding domain
MTIPPADAWPPRTEEQLLKAADNGLLAEGQRLDIKRTLPPGDAGNKEIAKDIAAFSLNGGVIIIGVDEDTSPPSLHAVDLNGLAERIQQVALSRIDEPVIISTTRIESSSSPGHGYLVIEVPISPRAPHMADNRYYGRADTTNRKLPDAEVFRLHEKRLTENGDIAAEAVQTVNRLLDENDGVDNLVAIIAKPLGAPDDLLMELCTSTGWRTEVPQLLFSARVDDHQQFVPNLTDIGSLRIINTPEGVAATRGMGAGHEEFIGTSNAAEVAFHDTGRIVLISERVVTFSAPTGNQVMERIVIGHTDLVVRLAGLVAQYGFNGSWQFGIAVAGLTNTRSYALSNDARYDEELPVHTNHIYKNATTATLNEILSSPQSVVRQLVSRLLRSVGSNGKFPWVFQQ